MIMAMDVSIQQVYDYGYGCEYTTSIQPLTKVNGVQSREARETQSRECIDLVLFYS